MPRAKVPVGSSSKRPCSSASICRAANLSCWATSATDKPCAARARASSSPTPAAASSLSVIFPALQLLVFARGGKPPPQLVGKAGFGDAFAELSLDPQRKPQRFRRRLADSCVTPDQFARLLEPALPVADLA